MSPRDMTVLLILLGMPILGLYAFGIRRYRLMPTTRRQTPQVADSSKRTAD